MLAESAKQSFVPKGGNVVVEGATGEDPAAWELLSSVEAKGPPGSWP